MGSNTYVVQIINDGKKFVVCPGTIHMKTTDSLKLIFPDLGGLLFIPKSYLFMENSGPIELLIDTKGITEKTFTINPEVTERVDTPYAFYCAGINDFAEGNSSPRIIIEEWFRIKK